MPVDTCPMSSLVTTYPATNTSAKNCTIKTTCASASCALCSTADNCAVCRNPTDWIKVDGIGVCVSTVSASSNLLPWARYESMASGCPSGYTLSGKTCIMQCSGGGCSICGSSASHCWKCSGSSMISNGRSVEGSCNVSTCAAGSAVSSDGSRCQQCDSSCATCTEAYSLGKCSTCPNPYLLLGQQPNFCVSTCPSGYEASGSICVVKAGSGSSSSKNDNSGWYAGAIVIGCVAVGAFIAFVVYIVIKGNFDDPTTAATEKSSPAPSIPTAQPAGQSSVSAPSAGLAAGPSGVAGPPAGAQGPYAAPQIALERQPNPSPANPPSGASQLYQSPKAPEGGKGGNSQTVSGDINRQAQAPPGTGAAGSSGNVGLNAPH